MNNEINTTIPNYSSVDTMKKQPDLKKVLYVLLCVLVLLVILIAIFLVNRKNISTRTFMIYMVGADLESNGSMGTYELNGIDPKLVDLENVNVVMIAGGAKRWNNDYIDVDETSIYQLTKEGFIKVKQQPIKNMGDTSTLSDFINFVTDHYVTDKYELLFWNHGGAILGSEFDELNGNDNLTLEEISKALGKTSFNEKNKMETIIFSTCLNGTIENANIFKSYADYYVASEEVSMSVKDMSDFNFINNVKLETDSLDIGRMFIEKYKDKLKYLKKLYEIKNTNYDIYSTYSIVDLNNLDNLNKAVNNFFGKIDVTKNYNEIAKSRSNLYQYGYNMSGEPSYDMVDLYNLILELKELAPKEAEQVLNEMEKTVIYNYATDPSSRGMSIYFPYNGQVSVKNGLLSEYGNISKINNYNGFISKFNSLMTTKASNKLIFKNNVAKVTSEDTESDFELELTDEQVANYARAQYLVYRDNRDGTYLPVYKGNEVKLDENTLKAKIKDRQLKLKSNEINDNIILFEDEIGDDYIKYSSYVVLENINEMKFDKATMFLLLDKKTNKVSISGIVLSSDGIIPGRAMVNINDYTHVVFASSSYNISNEDGTFNENAESNGVIQGIEADVNELEFELQDYNDGYDYYCVFKIFDVNNNVYYSKLVKLK